MSESQQPRKYWNDIKAKFRKEQNQLSEKIGQLILLSSEGKKNLTDVLDSESVVEIAKKSPKI